MARVSFAWEVHRSEDRFLPFFFFLSLPSLLPFFFLFDAWDVNAQRITKSRWWSTEWAFPPFFFFPFFLLFSFFFAIATFTAVREGILRNDYG